MLAGNKNLDQQNKIRERVPQELMAETMGSGGQGVNSYKKI